MENLVKDLKYGLRMLLARPGFAAVAMLSLALGIGLNTTIFSLVNAVLIRPLPVERPDQLVEVYSSSPTGLEYSTNSYPDYVDFRKQNDVFSGLVGHSLMLANFNRQGRSELVIGEVVTANYFEVLGVDALLGRTFSPEQDRGSGSHPVVLLGHGFWQRQFGGDPGALGQSFQLNGLSYTVIGIVPQSFTGTVPGFAPELWIPVSMVAEVEPMGINDDDGKITGDTRLEQRGRRWMFVKGRLKPGVSLPQAQAQMATLAARLAREYPDSNKDRSVILMPAGEVRIHPIVDGALTAYRGPAS